MKKFFELWVAEVFGPHIHVSQQVREIRRDVVWLIGVVLILSKYEQGDEDSVQFLYEPGNVLVHPCYEFCS